LIGPPRFEPGTSCTPSRCRPSIHYTGKANDRELKQGGVGMRAGPVTLGVSPTFCSMRSPVAGYKRISSKWGKYSRNKLRLSDRTALSDWRVINLGICDRRCPRCPFGQTPSTRTLPTGLHRRRTSLARNDSHFPDDHSQPADSGSAQRKGRAPVTCAMGYASIPAASTSHDRAHHSRYPSH